MSNIGVKDLDALRAANPMLEIPPFEGKLISLDVEGRVQLAADKFITKTLTAIIPADLAAADTTTETIIGVIPIASAIMHAKLFTSGVVAADAVNYAEVNVYTRTSSGGSQTKLGTISSAAGWANALGLADTSAFGLDPVAGSAAAAYTVVTYDIAKTVLGAKLPACVLVVEYRVA